MLLGSNEKFTFLDRNDTVAFILLISVESQNIDEIFFCWVVFLMKGVTSDNEVRVNVLMCALYVLLLQLDAFILDV